MPSIKDILEKHLETPGKLLDVLSVDTIDDRSQQEYIEEYKGDRTRRTKSVQAARHPKQIDVMDENGKVIDKKTIYPAQLIYNFPKKIVRTAVHFLFGGNMSISTDEVDDDASNEFDKVWDKGLKMQTKLKSLARTCMIETKAALLFYTQSESGEKSDDPDVVKDLKLRCRVLNSENGEFYPHFDDLGDMDAFTRKYKIQNVDGKDVEKAVIYTKDYTMWFTHEDGFWAPDKGKPNRFNKIPVVYVEQSLPEWESIVSLMDAFENRVSRLADTNDYFAEPLLKLYGSVKRAPGKDEVGKMIEFELKTDPDGKITHGDAEYATWDHIPESIKVELDTVKEGIYSMSSTPDLSFNNIKGLSVKAAKALQFMFMDALMKKEENGEIFFDALNRAISVVVAGITNITAIKFGGKLNSDEINVNFTDQLPDDMEDFILSLVAATGGKPIMSQETAASLNPLISDPSEEVDRLKNESAVNESFQM